MRCEPRLVGGRPQLAIVCAVLVLALSLWFSASAVGPALQREWHLGAGQIGLLTSSVQIGFVVGALAMAVLNLADRIRPHLLMSVCCAAGAGLNMSLALWSDGLSSAVPLRVGIGMSLAGVYPVGMRVVAAWFPKRSALALGVLVSALTLGSTLPSLLRGVPELHWKAVLLISSALASAAALLAVRCVRLPPDAALRTRIHPSYALEIFRTARLRRINFGYFGHMWELYALWAWFPVFVLSLDRPPGSLFAGEQRVYVLSFLALGLGGVCGCLLGGALGARHGPQRVAVWALFASGLCCLLVPWVEPGPWLAVTAPVWGAAVIADSAQFSSALAAAVPQDLVGTALTVQTAIGFLVTIVSIQALPLVAESAGWSGAMMLLALGPVFGIVSMTKTRAGGRHRSLDLNEV